MLCSTLLIEVLPGENRKEMFSGGSGDFSQVKNLMINAVWESS